ncbi:MAG: hypothetical protein JWN43_4259 [Gammaproteobacteria bacterium]|nr:hypothetical protein [Gammaproteobacteria bacterium]
MLAGDPHRRRQEELNYSLASDIVELVIVSTDAVFMQTLRDAVGGARRLWHVPSAEKVGDLLLAGQVGILVLDVQALPEAPTVFVTEIKRQFPELVVVVAGQRDAETALANHISSGAVYRFIHKPMSPGRAKLFADAAVKKYDEQRKPSPLTPGLAWATAANRPLIVCAVVGVLITGMAAAWVLLRGTSQESTPYTVTVGKSPADNASARASAGLAEVHERLLARAQSALLEERLDEAATAIETARKAGVESARIAFLTAQLSKSREQLKKAIAQAHIRSDSPGGDSGSNTAQAATQTLAPALPEEPPEPLQSDSDAGISAAEPNTASPEAEPAASRQIFPSDVVSATGLTLVRSVRPIYPARAERTKIEGWVELDFTVSETGGVRDIAVHAANPAGIFDNAAITAVSQWRYKPVLLDAKPAAQRSRIRIRFALTG